MTHPFFAAPTPLVIGHRGCAGEAPENTLASFDLALRQGAHIIESDIHTTRDGVPVLVHDDAVDRCTNGTGRVDAHSWEELKTLDAGYRFTRNGTPGHPQRGRGLAIPSLEEAFATFPDTRFNLEIKQLAPGFVERCVEIVVAAGREPLTLLTAGEDAVMTALRQTVNRTGSKVALGASLADILAHIDSAQRGTPPPPHVHALQVPPEFGGQPLVTREFLDHAHAHGIQVHVWTLNDPLEMSALLDLGVDGIVTDHPGRLVDLLATRTEPN
ncbi:glycerophosphodiester phosphodiesterase [Myxococcota bacterium]|nr:glycerophosphodiester phosphodiesterase [Myxococcota bacterium]